MSERDYNEERREEYSLERMANYFRWLLPQFERKQGEDAPDYLGDVPLRPGIAETPERMAKAWAFWTQGNRMDVASLFKTFEDGAEGTDEMVGVYRIPFYSHCEHHLAPIFGHASVAYVPDGKIIGLSKLSRVVDAFARRLQVQERMTTQIAEAVMQHLAPRGVGVQVVARHLCMESRGVRQQGQHTTTTKLMGCFREDGTCRAEFLDACREKL